MKGRERFQDALKRSGVPSAPEEAKMYEAAFEEGWQDWERHQGRFKFPPRIKGYPIEERGYFNGWSHRKTDTIFPILLIFA